MKPPAVVLTAPMPSLRRALALAPLALACAHRPHVAAPLVALHGHSVSLPGSPDPVRMDYLAYDPATRQLWIPAGNTARVDVLDTTDGSLASIEGFATAQRMIRGTARTIGPSSAAVGEGVVYVGNRADSTVCAVDAVTRARRACVTVESEPDGLAWVPGARELWVTLPASRALVVLPADASGALQRPVRVPLRGMPEGYAVDAARGIFYTNLEDGDRTLAIDVRTRRVLAEWSPGCGRAGPRGLALDAARRRLFVACTDAVVALDAGGDGAVLGRAPTGGGVDSIAFVASRQLVYAASGATGALRVLRVGSRGGLTAVAGTPTERGARAVVVDERGRGYVADSLNGEILVIDPMP
jgi:YVTN family beta-propeller protein